MEIGKHHQSELFLQKADGEMRSIVAWNAEHEAARICWFDT